MNHKERAESLRHCRWVDEVVENAPWFITQEFIDEHRIDFVSHGEDACLDSNGNDVYKFVKDQGKFRTIKRTEGISTSDIILRIVKDYDSYVKRNLSRGYTGKEMNVGVLKEQALKVEEKLTQFKTQFKNSMDQFKVWSDQTEHRLATFLQRFSKRITWEKLVNSREERQKQLREQQESGDFISSNGVVTSPSQSDFYYLSPDNNFQYDQDDSLIIHQSPPTLDSKSEFLTQSP
eukprot:gene3882-4844_t